MIAGSSGAPCHRDERVARVIRVLQYVIERYVHQRTFGAGLDCKLHCVRIDRLDRCRLNPWKVRMRSGVTGDGIGMVLVHMPANGVGSGSRERLHRTGSTGYAAQLPAAASGRRSPVAPYES